MKLIGMLDSPYVRRVAISLQLLGIRFEHQSLSVFGAFEEFQQINPLVKAPTLICDDGEVLMESTLILQYAEAIARPDRSLMPTGRADHQHALRLIGLALGACDKSVQIVYERKLRPEEKQHEPWVTRVTGQLMAAYEMLELEWRKRPTAVSSDTLDQASISTAVAWRFTQKMLPGMVDSADFPALQALSQQAEALREFSAAPCGSTTYREADAAKSVPT